MKVKNTRLLKALRCEPVDQIPLWLMRQAGRYLPEYRAVRERAGSFLNLCQTPELACEVTLQPVERFDLDAAILFSDILTVPHAMGLPVTFIEGEGPVFGKTIKTFADVQALKNPDPECELRYVMEAVRLIQQTLKGRVPLIGFAGSPWTVAAYMVEGGGSKTFSLLRSLMYREPLIMHALLARITHSTIQYLQAQVSAGADVIQLFDTWGGLLGYDTYLTFSLKYMDQIVKALAPTPTIVFTKGGGLWLSEIAKTGCQGIGLDWSIDPKVARATVGPHLCLQGNLDPAVLYGSPETIQSQVKLTLARFESPQGLIFNLGHGMHPDMDPEKVQCLVNAVRG